MNILAKAILRRVFDRIDTTAEVARLPAVYQAAGGGLVRRIAAAGILRLALRWPAFSVILILSVVAALELPTGAADTHGNWATGR